MYVLLFSVFLHHGVLVSNDTRWFKYESQCTNAATILGNEVYDRTQGKAKFHFECYYRVTLDS
jgi:hypothetical protein